MPKFLDRFIDNLDREYHLPGGYRFCGPGTDLEKRLKQSPKNKLDEFCKEHDLKYSLHKDRETRSEADKILGQKAWSRVLARDSSLGERANSLLVSAVMKTKRALGFGHKKKTFKGYVKQISRLLKHSQLKSPTLAANFALRAARKLKSKVKVPKTIALPKEGGILPLIPIMSVLSAIGALAGGASSIVNTVKKVQQGAKEFDELKRHNQKIEENIAVGNGLFLRPYGYPGYKGYGLTFSARKVSLKRKKKNIPKMNWKIPLNSNDLEKYLSPLSSFRGVFMRDSLPLKPKYNEDGVLNLDSQHASGTHWTAYKKRGNRCFYFDPFGDLLPPVELRQYFHGLPILYNKDRFQDFNSVICGQLCVEYLYKKTNLFAYKTCQPLIIYSP